VFKLMGDAFLAEFPSAADAVRCAAAIQEQVEAREPEAPAERRIRLRMGVHLGDVVVEGGDLLGDGVNLAARLEALAEPGGVVISRQVHEQVEGKLGLAIRPLGARALKNVARPVEAFALGPGGGGADAAASPPSAQRIGHCRAADGTRLAHAAAGSGPVLVKAANWMNHLELDWASPAFGPMLHGIARDFTLVRHDARGNGLSDWEAGEVSLDAWVGDLEAVVEANGLARVPLLGMSQGAAVAVAYAARHPERVTRLVLLGGFARGHRRRGLGPERLEAAEAMRSLLHAGWGADRPAFRQLFAALFMPDAGKVGADAFAEQLRLATAAECAVRYWDAVAEIDVTGLLARVRAPALVLHARGDGVVPLEEGRLLAAGVPGARFVAMPGRNHLLLAGDPALGRFLEEMRLFLGGPQAIPGAAVDPPPRPRGPVRAGGVRRRSAP
jgi:pimeloyl-ACP methyl ester carboxylesterase